MKLLVTETFQFNGIRREGVTLTVPESVLLEEIKKGFHTEKEGVWLSGLLQHCVPSNSITKEFIKKHSGVDVDADEEEGNEEDESARIKDIWAEFEDMNKPFDKRWGLERLENELIKAKRSYSEAKARKPVTQNISEG